MSKKEMKLKTNARWWGLAISAPITLLSYISLTPATQIFGIYSLFIYPGICCAIGWWSDVEEVWVSNDEKTKVVTS